METHAPDSAPTRAPRSLPVHAFIFGGIAGALGAAIRWASFAFGFHGSASEIVVLFVPLIAIILGVQRWRDGVLRGDIRFAQAFGAGLAIGLAHALVMGAIGWLHARVAGVDLVEALAAGGRAMMEERGATPEQVAEAEANFRQHFTATAYGLSLFAQALIIAFIASLMAALFVRRKVAA